MTEAKADSIGDKKMSEDIGIGVEKLAGNLSDQEIDQIEKQVEDKIDRAQFASIEEALEVPDDIDEVPEDLDDEEMDFQDEEARDFGHLQKIGEAASPESGEKKPQAKRISSNGLKKMKSMKKRQFDTELVNEDE